MNYWQAFLLGIVQGITEFLPVSSSAHLKLAQIFFGLGNSPHFLFFDVVCHIGTLLAIVVFFRKNLREFFFKYGKALAIGTLPLFPLVLFLKPLKVFFEDPKYLSFFFLVTAFLLFLGEKWTFKKKGPSLSKDAFFIGCFQGMAILPGISRSGATISGGKILGWSKEEAFIFSFLLAIPAVLGSLTLESLKIFFSKDFSFLSFYSLEHLLLSGGTSFLMGLFSLHFLFRILKKSSLLWFSLYLVLLSLFCFFFFS